ncbi:MAG: phosphoglucosamine mutase [Bacteroidetes bacterium]|nr:phosphoglucosamine mutase [Bacteroidota bacterium]
MALMISVSGIRGIFGEDLNPENLARFAAAYGSWAKGGTIVLGRDSRVTGELCERVVTAALQSVGCDVIHVGIVPTPTVAMGVIRHKAAGGIVISASHNPAQWNALKLLNAKSEFLDASEGAKVMEIANSDEGPTYVSFDKIGKTSVDDSLADWHIDQILNLPYINADVIGKANFRVAVDAVNGAGSLIVPQLLKRLGVKQIHTIHCTPNGLFPHNPEPLPEHLSDICTLVKERSADIGVVVDPDADRLALVDENGTLIGEEYTLPAAVDFHLEKKPGDIVVNLSSSRICEDIAQKYGVTCHRSAVGEINVVKKMQEVGAVISGEGNGGVINPDLHAGRDALVGIAMVLQMLAERSVSLGEYRKLLPDYHILKTKVELGSVNADEVLTRVAALFKEEQVTTIDGVKIDFENGWVHLRKSNTEPIIRVYSEARSAQEAMDIAKPVMDQLR